jgi:ubiquinone/menaquinone biosynthesis C-methylase UbiE/uncharacterized protein YbaR (Trm112 family)
VHWLVDFNAPQPGQILLAAAQLDHVAVEVGDSNTAIIHRLDVDYTGSLLQLNGQTYYRTRVTSHGSPVTGLRPYTPYTMISMQTETLAILCSPLERAPLELAADVTANGELQQFLVNHEHGLKFPIRDCIPIFVEPHQITGINHRFRRIYDNWAPFYDLLSKIGLSLLGISEHKLRKEFVEMLGIQRGDRVLATSVGTGSDLPFLLRNCDFFGLDLSAGMLKVCQRKMRKLGVPAELFLGMAEHLPFRDGSFDVVYQMGGINFFSDQGKAIQEMIRVARSGSKIAIMDETEKVARRLEHIPGINAWFRHQHRPIVPPTTLIPAGMEEVKYRELYHGQAWHLSFRTPR